MSSLPCSSLWIYNHTFIFSYFLYPLLSFSIHSKTNLNKPLAEQFPDQHHGCWVHLGKCYTHMLIHTHISAVLFSFQSDICSCQLSCFVSRVIFHHIFSILKLSKQNLSMSERPWTQSTGITLNFYPLKKKTWSDCLAMKRQTSQLYPSSAKHSL